MYCVQAWTNCFCFEYPCSVSENYETLSKVREFNSKDYRLTTALTPNCSLYLIIPDSAILQIYSNDELGHFHWLKVDFNKWKDEDDSEDEGVEGTDFEEMMRKMGSASEGGDANCEDENVDSDDEELPDLE
ncbi:UNVERIFIED_CONTAM: hypothetical protein NCL1_29106 [Trichonephila clavipes]